MFAVASCLSVLAFVSASGGQDGDRRLDDLIEYSNGLRSFVAEYRFYARHKEGEDEIVPADVRIVYQAPGRARVSVSSDHGSMCMVTSDGKMFMSSRGWEGSDVKGSVDMPAIYGDTRAEIVRLFREQFPKTDVREWTGIFGAYFHLGWKEASGLERPSFSFTCGVRDAEMPLLTWLGTLKRTGRAPRVENESLVYELDGGFRISLQKDSGFVSTASCTYEGVERTMLELVELDLDTEVDSKEFDPPEDDPSAKDISTSLQEQLLLSDHASLRRTFEGSLGRMVESDQLEWDAEAKSRLRRVLRVIHEESAPLIFAAWIDSTRSWIDELCRWYQSARQGLSEDEVPESLEDQVRESEERLRTSLDKATEAYVSRAVQDLDDESASPISRDAREIEREVAEAAYRKIVVDPLIERFAERMELARQGALPATKD